MAAAYSTGWCRSHWQLYRIAATLAGGVQILRVFLIRLILQDSATNRYPPGNQSFEDALSFGICLMASAAVLSPVVRIYLSNMCGLASLYALDLTDLRETKQVERGRDEEFSDDGLSDSSYTQGRNPEPCPPISRSIPSRGWQERTSRSTAGTAACPARISGSKGARSATSTVSTLGSLATESDFYESTPLVAMDVPFEGTMPLFVGPGVPARLPNAQMTWEMLMAQAASRRAEATAAHCRVMRYHSARIWNRLRLLYIGQRDAASPLNLLSHDSVRLVMQHALRACLGRLDKTIVGSPIASWRQLALVSR